MKKILVLVLAVLVSGKAMALEVFACEGKSTVMSPGKTLHMKMLLDEKSKDFSVYANGIKSEDRVTLMTPKLPNLEEYLKCGSYDEACKQKYEGIDKGFAEAAGVLAVSKALSADTPKDKQSSLVGLDVKNIGKARIYQLGDTSKFGGMGIYEYFDKSDKLMGRYIFAVETMDCRNKTTPTEDAGKELRKLMEGAKGSKKSKGTDAFR